MLISTNENECLCAFMCYFGTAFICIKNIARTFIMKSMVICGLVMVYTWCIADIAQTHSTAQHTLTIIHFVPPI